MKNIITVILLLGMVEYVYEHDILISYQMGSKTFHSRVSKDLSACLPVAGQQVYFLKDYKVLECKEES